MHSSAGKQKAPKNSTEKKNKKKERHNRTQERVQCLFPCILHRIHAISTAICECTTERDGFPKPTENPPKKLHRKPFHKDAMRALVCVCVCVCVCVALVRPSLQSNEHFLQAATTFFGILLQFLHKLERAERERANDEILH